MTLIAANGTRYSDPEARLAAQAAYRRSVTEGVPLTGDQLGARFPRADNGTARSPEWGRKMIRAARSTDAAPAPPAAQSGTGHGTPVGGLAPAPSRQKSTVTKGKGGTVEAPARDRWQVTATVAVGAVAATWSAAHTVHLARMAGAGTWAWLVPIVIDGLIFVCGRHVRTVDGYWVAKLGLALGIIATFAANLIAIDPSLADMRHVLRVMALAPPAAFIVCVHLLERGKRT